MISVTSRVSIDSSELALELDPLKKRFSPLPWTNYLGKMSKREMNLNFTQLSIDFFVQWRKKKPSNHPAPPVLKKQIWVALLYVKALDTRKNSVLEEKDTTSLLTFKLKMQQDHLRTESDSCLRNGQRNRSDISVAITSYIALTGVMVMS